MKVDLTQHLLTGVSHIPSPNYDRRPPQVEIELIVIHGISLPSGLYGGHEIEQLFTNRLTVQQCADLELGKDLRVSAHLLIRRNGEIIQFVPFNRRAWHAGESNYKGRRNCNDYSIGIEVEGCDTQPYEKQQYESLRSVISALVVAYPKLDSECISYHSDIAPGRKTDPGPSFDRDFMQGTKL
ncbi:MAG: 1,6-anhydro-N-acetylmuramyl-L-alanine amidase AmpD [Chromatiales bacterium]|nr:1,6-anhydro-N-acetylmuramyl-L-alanine amidase AmpD [Chromatiales bacterium]